MFIHKTQSEGKQKTISIFSSSIDSFGSFIQHLLECSLLFHILERLLYYVPNKLLHLHSFSQAEKKNPIVKNEWALPVKRI